MKSKQYSKLVLNSFLNINKKEQIVSLEQDYKTPVPYMSTIVQLRGSIPLFWSQSTAALNPRPNITLYNMDPLYESTEKHFKVF